MKISVIVHANPISSPGSVSALAFCRAAVSAGHHISQVFFYRDGVYIANKAAVLAQSQADDLSQQWLRFASDNEVPLATCIASAASRGLHDAVEADRHDQPATLVDGFDIAGLGQLIEVTLLSDRTVSFGD